MNGLRWATLGYLGEQQSAIYSRVLKRALPLCSRRADSKSSARKGVRVRVSPPVLLI